jgi:hypothetical protein
MKWLRRILLLIAILLCAVVSAALVGIYLYRCTPGWYHPQTLSEEELKANANSADQKMADTISWAASVQAQAVRRHHGGAAATEAPIGSKTVTLSENELNAFFGSWQNPDKSQLQARLAKYFSDGRLVLVDHEIILAGQSKSLGTLVSIHLQPSIDEGGKLRLQWEGVSAGMLPVPQAVIGGQLQKMRDSLQEELTFWQRSADVDQTMTANATAVESGMSRLLLDAMNDKESSPLFFVPFDLQDLHHALAVRVSAIEVSDGSLTLTLEPLTADDRSDVLGWIRKPYDSSTPNE